MVSEVFVGAAAPRTRSSLWNKSKDLFACIVNLEKAYDQVPQDKLWKVLPEYGVDSQLLVQKSHSTADRRFVFK